jgi:hypothetical protein
MKTSPTTITALYTKWTDAWWSMLTGRLPGLPVTELTPKAAQVVADQEWEDEGGTIKAVKKPAGAEPATKIPF